MTGTGFGGSTFWTTRKSVTRASNQKETPNPEHISPANSTRRRARRSDFTCLALRVQCSLLVILACTSLWTSPICLVRGLSTSSTLCLRRSGGGLPVRDMTGQSFSDRHGPPAVRRLYGATVFIPSVQSSFGGKRLTVAFVRSL